MCVVPRGQPWMLVGDFNVEPTKIPCLAKGISDGLWVDLEASWALASCMRLLLASALGILLVCHRRTSWYVALLGHTVLPVKSLPELTGQMLADVVRAQGCYCRQS